MREIKFRAWLSDTENKSNQQMIYSGDSPLYEARVWRDFWNDYRAWQGNVREVMQYTGLKDKNGKEIYEGDILYCDEAPGSHHKIFWNTMLHGWDDERMEDGDSNSGYYGFASFSDRKIIGNIYENPELLK